MVTIPRSFTGTARLYGENVWQRFQSSHIVVVGVGGVGSWSAETLARSGIGEMTLIDLDHVAESNINRQIQALSSTLGQAKVLAMKARIEDIYQDCVVHIVEDFLTTDNISTLIPSNASAVIDATDDVPAKIALSIFCQQAKIPFVLSGSAGGRIDATRIFYADLAEVHHDPLLTKVRQKLRQFHQISAFDSKGKLRKMGVATMFSDEQIRKPVNCETGNLNCHGYGSHMAVTASMGILLAGRVLNQIACHE